MLHTKHLHVCVSLITEIIIDKVGVVIYIQAQGTCETNYDICIAPGGSNAKCYYLYQDAVKLQELNYTLTSCSNGLVCLKTTVRIAMNNTLFTVRCSQSFANSPSYFVGATSKLIVAGK